MTTQTKTTSRLAPLTKILATLFFSAMAILLVSPLYLCIVIAVEWVWLFLAGALGKQRKALVAFAVFAGILGIIQYLFVWNVSEALEIALRMYAMATIFLLLLVTTSLKALTTALVEQCRIPYEYAFMFTAALRFIPDFLAESKAVREAQMCRGMAVDGHWRAKFQSYGSIVQPLVLRSLGRSETMALSLELRGFGGSMHRFSQRMPMGIVDYALVLGMSLATIACAWLRFHGWA